MRNEMRSSVRARMSAVSIAALLAAAGVNQACQSSAGANTALQPTVVEPPRTTKTFSGTVAVNGQDKNNFTTLQNGTLDITLTAAGPPDTVVMRLGLGQPSTTDSTACINQFGISVDTRATTTPQITVPAPAGAYCVAVAEIGNATGPVNYTVTVKGAFGG